MTRYCQDCGDPHECPAQMTGDDPKTQIRLAEIDRDKAVRIAEIQASADATTAAAAVDIAAVEAESGQAEAEGRADGMETVLDDLGASGGQADGDGGQADGADPAEVFPAELEQPLEPAPAPSDSPPPPAPKGRSGWWDAYQ